MRVLMTADTLGGVFSYALDLSRALQVHGVQVVLATLGRPLTSSQKSELRNSPVLDVHESSYALEWMDEPWSDVEASGAWLRKIAERTAPDCIHFNHFAHAPLRWSAPCLVVAHSCVVSWWQAVHGSPPGQHLVRYRACVRAGLRAASRVVAPTATMRESVLGNYGPLARVDVIPNGINHARFAPRAKIPCVFAAGRIWDEAKNIRALDRIAASLRWPVYVAGDATAPGATKSDAARPTMNALGPLGRAAIAEYFGTAAIYALPARYEPFGLSVLEAAASGCALVLGNIPSLLENWYGAACFVDSDDDGALRDAINRLIEDDTLREAYGAAARKRALAFSAARMAASYAELYAELCAASPKGLSCA